MVFTYILLGLLAVYSILFLICCARANRYNEYITPLDDKEFAGKELFGIGFAFMDLIKFDFSSESVQKIRDQIVVVYGKKYADYYLRVSFAQKFSYCMLFFYLSLMMGCLPCSSDGIMLFIVGVIATAAVYMYYSSLFAQKIEKMNQQYMNDFPNAISTIALLVNAGMFLRDAWKEVAFSNDTPLYKQMQQVVEDMNNGMSESDALYMFANRCSTNEIRKFTSMIVQAIEKGGKELTNSLTKQADSLWNAKRQRTIQAGEKAANKLMAPIAIMFVGILVVIMMPILTNLGI